MDALGACHSRRNTSVQSMQPRWDSRHCIRVAGTRWRCSYDGLFSCKSVVSYFRVLRCFGVVVVFVSGRSFFFHSVASFCGVFLSRNRRGKRDAVSALARREASQERWRFVGSVQPTDFFFLHTKDKCVGEHWRNIFASPMRRRDHVGLRSAGTEWGDTGGQCIRSKCTNLPLESEVV